MIIKAHSEQGIGLVAVLLVLAVISAVASTMIAGNMAELQVSNNFSHKSVAFYAADSGLDATIRDLRTDTAWIAQLVSPTTYQAISPVPSGLSVNGNPVTLVSGTTYSLGSTTTLGDGTYTRLVTLPPVVNIIAGDGTITFPVTSTGAGGLIDPGSQRVRGDVEIEVRGYGVWDNAIFAAEGQAGNYINGNVAVRGSVHIIGDPDNPPTITFGGTADIRNNYADAPTAFGADFWKLPTLTPVDFNGESVQSLEAVFRLANGTADFTGSADVGMPDTTGNTLKETMDAIRTNGTVGPANEVHSDAWESYDADSITFPSLDDPATDPLTGISYPSHRDYLDAVSLTVAIPEISIDIADFSYSSGGNSISWDRDAGRLTISGIVKVNGNIRLGRDHGQSSTRGFSYAGTGTLYATGDIEIDGAVTPVGAYLDQDNMGFISGTRILIDRTAQINVFGALFSEGTIRVTKQTDVAGAMVTRYFDLGNNVPAVFQVPALATNLPPGMPGSGRFPVIAGARVANWYHER